MPRSASNHRPRSRLIRLAGYLLGCIVGALASPSFAADATLACCNIVELRQYTLRPRQRDAFIQLFDSTFADPLDAAGMTVIGEFRDLDRPDRFVWMRGFPDMPSRAAELAAFYDSDLWHAHRNEVNASIDDSDNVLLLEPASPTLELQAIPPRSRAGAVEQKAGLIVTTLYYTKPEKLADFAALFERSLHHRADHLGARTLTGYVTSTQANNFPQLPVRVGEHIYVWIAYFASPEAYAAYQKKRDTDRRWNQTLWPKAQKLLICEPEILRLKPTTASRLRG